MHCWYWISDLCEEHGIQFFLGHALYMKAIHGGKTKNDRIDSFKIAMVMRGGNFPLAYVYPKEMRATRDLCAVAPALSCTPIVRHGAMLKAHAVNTLGQYNLPHSKANLNNPGGRSQLTPLLLLIQTFSATSIWTWPSSIVISTNSKSLNGTWNSRLNNTNQRHSTC